MGPRIAGLICWQNVLIKQFNMLDLKQFSQAVQQIADEKSIPKEKIFETIEMALAAAYKRDYGKRGQIIRAQMDHASGKVNVKQVKIVVDETMIRPEEEEEPEPQEEETGRRRRDDDDIPEILPGSEEAARVRFNPERHIMLNEAKKIKSDIQPGDELEFTLEYHDDFGRIAAQTAKQVIIQRIREIEREAVFEEFKDRQNEVASGIVQRIEGRNVFVDIGRTTGILSPDEQIPGERYRIAQRLKVLILSVDKTPRGPSIFLSRSHPKFLAGLFLIEVPEIAAGSVEIKNIAREPGARSKVAAVSHESGIDPVGSLVGQKGIRVATVIAELNGEKIDIIEWSKDDAEFIANALSPAKVLDVRLHPADMSAQVVVADTDLSLAIGKGGQNVRLAAKLTGWRIDVIAMSQTKPTIKTETGVEEEDKVEEATDTEEPAT